MKPINSDMHVPEELRSIPGWLMWRFEQFVGEAKPRKIPFWADGKREVLDARWEDFDFESRLWKIPVTKSGKPRYVPISDGLIAILKSVPRLAGSRYVFPNPDTGKPYVTIFYSWNTARQRAGLPDVRIHDLRHSFASILINSGRSLYEVQHLLGHTQSKTTERYAHLQRETLLNAANVVANMVGGAVPARAAVALTHV